jgi:hypothetical protein
MKISDRLYKKYAANTVILPPPPESEEEVISERSPESGEEDLTQISLKRNPLPVIKEPTEKEMKFWEQWLSATNNLKGFNIGENASGDVSTIPPGGKKASSIDKLVKLCEEFQSKTEMLPPPMELGQGLNVRAPSDRPLSEKDFDHGRDFSKWDDYVPERDFEEEDLLRSKKHQAEVDELTWQVQKYLGESELEKQNDIPTEMIPPALPTERSPADTIVDLPKAKNASIDHMLKLCERFNDLCSKF